MSFLEIFFVILGVILLFFLGTGFMVYVIMTPVRFIKSFRETLNSKRRNRIVADIYNMVKEKLNLSSNKKAHDYIDNEIFNVFKGTQKYINNLNFEEIVKLHKHIYEKTHKEVIREKYIDEILKSD